MEKECKGVLLWVCLIRLKISQEYIPYYIYLSLQTKNFTEYIKSVSCGTSAQPNLQIGDLLNYEFNEHSLSEQQHIVNSINCEVKYAC